MGDTSPRPRPSAAFASGLCLSAQTSWERSAPELVFSSLSPSSTNTLRSLSRSKAKWAAWERCCSKIHTNHFYLLFCSHLFILPPRRHHHHIRRESIVYCEEQKVNASTKLFAQDETKQGKHSADDSMIPLSCSSPPPPHRHENSNLDQVCNCGRVFISQKNKTYFLRANYFMAVNSEFQCHKGLGNLQRCFKQLLNFALKNRYILPFSLSKDSLEGTIPFYSPEEI